MNQLTSPSSSNSSLKQQHFKKVPPKSTQNKKDTRSRLTAKLEQIKEGNSNPAIATPNNQAQNQVAFKDESDDGFGFEDVSIGGTDVRDDRSETVIVAQKGRKNINNR